MTVGALDIGAHLRVSAPRWVVAGHHHRRRWSGKAVPAPIRRTVLNRGWDTETWGLEFGGKFSGGVFFPGQ